MKNISRYKSGYREYSVDVIFHDIYLNADFSHHFKVNEAQYIWFVVGDFEFTHMCRVLTELKLCSELEQDLMVDK